MSGTKFDEGKPPCSLISSDALLELSRVLGYGAQKYSSHNWRSGFKWSRVMDAALRHLYRYNSGERIDPETGISHLTHAFCNLMFLVDFEKNNVGENDLWAGYKNQQCKFCGNRKLPCDCLEPKDKTDYCKSCCKQLINNEKDICIRCKKGNK